MFCPHCGKEVADTQSFCQFCGGRIGEGGLPGGTGRIKTSWEDPKLRWTPQGLLASLRGVLFSPSDFFRNMNVSGGLTDPILFALFTGMGGWMAYYFWQIILTDRFGDLVPLKGASGMAVLQGTGMVIAAILTPFLLIISLFVASGVMHVLLLMVRGAKNGFEATFRVIAYGTGVNILLVIPVCGAPIAAIWAVVLAIIGLKEAHGISGGKAATAVLFPFILCCAATLLLLMAIFGTMAASLGTITNQPWK